MTEWVDAARVAAALAGLSFAAYTDSRTREVPDGVWYALGALAFGLFAADLHTTYGGAAAVMAVPAGLVFAVAVLGGEFVQVVKGEGALPDDYTLSAEERRRLRVDIGLSAAALAGAVAVFAIAPGLDLGRPAGFLQGPQVQAFVAILMFGLAYLMFLTSLLAGGADAKCLIVLALLFPVAPALPGLPLVQPPALAVLAVPFALAIFFNGAIVLVAARLPVAPIVSLRRGTFRFPESLAGIPKPVDKVNLDREWILGVVKDGKWKRKLMPTHGTHSDAQQQEALQFLKDRGEATVFVSPRFPFMVYLLVGFVLLLVVSCPLYFVGGLR